MADDVGTAFCACTTALWGRVEGGRVVASDKGRKWCTLGVRGLRGFFAGVGLTGGAGVARGDSWGESRRLMSMVRVASRDDQATKLLILCTVEE